jgi:hypothetical protein
MKAYGELYDCADLVLLYPRQVAEKTRRCLPIRPSGSRMLRVAGIDISADHLAVENELAELVGGGGKRLRGGFSRLGIAMPLGAVQPSTEVLGDLPCLTAVSALLKVGG